MSQGLCLSCLTGKFLNLKNYHPKNSRFTESMTWKGIKTIIIKLRLNGDKFFTNYKTKNLGLAMPFHP
mgnify:CR=1 FL=1